MNLTPLILFYFMIRHQKTWTNTDTDTQNWDVDHTHHATKLSLDNTRGHTVDPDVALSQLRGQGPRQAQQRSLTHAVGTQGLWEARYGGLISQSI